MPPWRRTLVLVALLGALTGAGGRANAGGSGGGAEKVQPGEKTGKSPKTGKLLDGVVNLNTAPAIVLLMLPGVGPGRVRDIVAYRARRPFRTVDELVRIRGIGRQLVRELRPHLAVAGPSTARAGVGGAAVAETVVAPPPVWVGPGTANPPGARPESGRPSTRPVAGRRHARAVRSPANQCAPPA